MILIYMMVLCTQVQYDGVMLCTQVQYDGVMYSGNDGVMYSGYVLT